MERTAPGSFNPCGCPHHTTGGNVGAIVDLKTYDTVLRFCRLARCNDLQHWSESAEECEDRCEQNKLSHCSVQFSPENYRCSIATLRPH